MIYLKFKRLGDVFAIVLTSPIWVPLLTIIYLVVLMKLGRPVFFKQERGGYKNSTFYILKFRTMSNEVDENGNLKPDNLRLTRFGKFLRSTSLDELPCLINIIKSEMSIIGPRPFLSSYLKLYNAEQRKRHDVKPGLTGWAQVNGRNTISWEQKFKYDLFYVKNISFSLDLKIIFLTVYKVFKREGVNAKEEITMEKFMGTK
jgi:sugar transferase EpsL